MKDYLFLTVFVTKDPTLGVGNDTCMLISFASVQPAGYHGRNQELCTYIDDTQSVPVSVDKAHTALKKRLLIYCILTREDNNMF